MTTRCMIAPWMALSSTAHGFIEGDPYVDADRPFSEQVAGMAVTMDLAGWFSAKARAGPGISDRFNGLRRVASGI